MPALQRALVRLEDTQREQAVRRGAGAVRREAHRRRLRIVEAEPRVLPKRRFAHRDQHRVHLRRQTIAVERLPQHQSHQRGAATGLHRKARRLGYRHRLQRRRQRDAVLDHQPASRAREDSQAAERIAVDPRFGQQQRGVRALVPGIGHGGRSRRRLARGGGANGHHLAQVVVGGRDPDGHGEVMAGLGWHGRSLFVLRFATTYRSRVCSRWRVPVNAMTRHPPVGPRRSGRFHRSVGRTARRDQSAREASGCADGSALRKASSAMHSSKIRITAG